VEKIIKITASGAGTGSGDCDAFSGGFLEAVEIKYSGGAGAGTVTITENDLLGRLLATVATNATNITVYPRAAAVNTAGSAITNSFARIYFSGYTLHAAISGFNAEDVIEIHIYISESFRE